MNIKDLEGDIRSLIKGTIPLLTWRDWKVTKNLKSWQVTRSRFEAITP